jgi:hypothetical protein
MPKKQKHPLYTRPSTGPHPSLALSRSANSATHGSSGAENNRSVAECLRNVKSEEARRLPFRPPPVATVHPSLRNLLDVPETPQPRPRTGLRATGNSQIRRIPGPPAPPSWQQLGNRHARRGSNGADLEAPTDTSEKTGREQTSLPGAKSLQTGSLLDTVLKAMAHRWDWHLQHDNYHLASIPLHLKECILSYVSQYAPEESLRRSINTLHVLFRNDNLSGLDDQPNQVFLEDSVEVSRLDLGRGLGTWLPTISSLKKELIQPSSPARFSSLDSCQTTAIETPESWDDIDASNNDSVNQLSPSLTTRMLSQLRFSKLVHLSLALPPSGASAISIASWPTLLSITSHLSILQSLSLKYWPCPTLTPHAAAASATIRNPVSRTLPRITYGGTDMYTESDASWREAAGILRKLSRHLYCLRWLDLTGCGTWFGALSWTDKAVLDDDNDPGSEVRHSEIGPDWNGSWRKVEYLGLQVGWTPPNVEGDNSIPWSASVDAKSHQPPDSPNNVPAVGATIGRGLIKQDWDVEEERKKYFARKELEKFKIVQARAHEVARHLRFLRESAGGMWIDIGL